MKKNLFKMVAALLLVSGLASCVYDRDSELAQSNGSQSGGSQLVINVNSNTVGTKTRATDIASIASNVNERTVSSLYVGLYSADGATHKGGKYFSDQTGVTTPAGWTKHVGFGTTEIEAGDKVMLVCNVTQSVADLLDAAATPADFQQVMSTIDQSMIFQDDYEADKTINDAKIPMFGTGVTEATANLFTFKVNVNVMHMLAKVSLTNLMLDPSLDDGVQFTPTAVFLINVPEKLDFAFGTEGDEKTYTCPDQTNFYQGESAAVETSDNVTTNGLTTRYFRDYLGTGDIADGTLDAVTNTAPLSRSFTFYTMPNLIKMQDDTRLVIRGNWSTDGGTTSEECWYSVALNNVEVESNENEVIRTLEPGIYPNRHYKVRVELKAQGKPIIDEDNTGAYNDEDGYILLTTITSEDWVDEPTEVSIDNGEKTYKPALYYGITVGSIIYADGEWSAKYDSDMAAAHGNPIAIVFSTETSAADKAAGYLYGYAMGLSLGAGCPNWATGTYQTRQVTDRLINNVEDLLADMDGLTHCRTAYETNSNSYNNLTAIQYACVNYATNVAAPERTSGWYLPSFGQMIAMFQAAMPETDLSTWNWVGDKHYRSGTAGSTAATSMDTWFTNQGLIAGTHFTTSFLKNRLLWSSVEWSAVNPVRLDCNDSSGGMGIVAFYDKTRDEGSTFVPVIAF